MSKLLMLLSNLQKTISSGKDIEITLLPNNEVQIATSGNTPTNYQYDKNDCEEVLKSLTSIVQYLYSDELSNYIEWKADQGVFIEGIGDNVTPVKANSIDKGHIFHDVLVLKEIVTEIENY